MPDQLTFRIEPSPFAQYSECEFHRAPGPACDEDCVGLRYRYLLGYPTAEGGNERICLFVLANPSTATSRKVDPTVARCIKWAGQWGFGWCHVANVRAWRATDPRDVPEDPKAIGPDNDRHIAEACRKAELVVCGWGKLGGARGPVVERIIRDTGHVPHALKLNADGSPGHPLYLPAAARPFPMEARHA